MYKNKRIYFDVVKEGDAEILQQFINDYELQAGTASTANWLMPDTLSEIKDQIKGGGFRFMVKTLKDDQVLGYVSASCNWVARTFEPMLYLSREHRSKGYGTEIMELVLHLGFMEMNLNKCCATVYSFNGPSINMFDKLKFQLEGTLIDEVFRKGDLWNVLKFGLFLEDWQVLEGFVGMKYPKDTGSGDIDGITIAKTSEKRDPPGGCKGCACLGCVNSPCRNCVDCKGKHNHMPECFGRVGNVKD